MIFFCFIRMENNTNASKKNDKKRSYTRLEFSAQDQETIINFVKEHRILYDPKHEDYKNKFKRDQLWNKLGTSIEKTGKLNSLKRINSSLSG